MTSSPWKYFFLHNLGRSFHIWCKIEVALNISKIFKMTKIWGEANFFVISVTGSKVCYQEGQSNFLHFELLIDVLTEKLIELWYFQNLTYFVTSWPSYLTYILVQRTCRNHGLVLACDQVWWWLIESILRFCESSVQTDRQTYKQTNMTNQHTCQNGNFGK